MTQEQLVDICRLMDINKDGLVDLNEFLESFRLAEKNLDDDIEEIEATWQQPGRPRRTAADRDETGLQVEVLRMDDGKRGNLNHPSTHLMGDRVAASTRAEEDIELIDSEPTPVRREGLLESNM